MEIRWRKQELIFAIMVFLLMGCMTLTKWVNGQNTDTSTLSVTFHYTVELLLTFGVPLLLLVLINTWLLPRFLYTRRQLFIFFGAIVVGWTILSTAHVLLYDLHLKYRLSHHTSRMPTAGQWQKARLKAVFLATEITVLYILYLWMRETIIKWISQQYTNNAILIIACNRITATFFLYFGLLIFLRVFKIFQTDLAGIIYISIVPAVIITVFINLYMLFPRQHRKRLSFFPFSHKLLIAPFVLSLVMWFFYVLLTGQVNLLILPAHFLIITIIATPLSWLLFIQQKNKLATRQLKKDLGKTTADLAFLRSQINPHFLFNTLNTLYGTALQENATRSATGIQQLGDMMRFLLHDNNRDEIPLNRELAYLQNYIALQRLRIDQSQGVTIETTINTCTHDWQIAPMLLIPFVENAFKHGIRLASPSFIRIHFYCDDKGIYLDVSNSIHPKRNEEGMSVHSGVGLQNVKQRLLLLYPDAHTLTIHQDDTAFETRLYIASPESN